MTTQLSADVALLLLAVAGEAAGAVMAVDIVCFPLWVKHFYHPSLTMSAASDVVGSLEGRCQFLFVLILLLL